ncbi:sulfur carrier protein ThiS [Haloferula rosea]|uniref:Sulfur carrier protein ThiS n=1 Tax=Haloferula rosea TaxID=490093 RepID=A0A934RAB8_9BACT|nr:sulfur carrier protein ThiS [Haloferula rosea]MBK1826943.1 sulfur carrier protein ThiS [Haloferula rosea]
MTLTINGEAREFDATEPTLTALLSDLGMAGKPVVVELNQEPILPGAHETTRVSDGDRIEIVTIAAGG